MTAKANALRWFGHVLRTEEDNPVKMAMSFEEREEKEGRLMSTWKRKVKDSFQKACLIEEDAFNRSKWMKCV